MTALIHVLGVSPDHVARAKEGFDAQGFVMHTLKESILPLSRHGIHDSKTSIPEQLKCEINLGLDPSPPGNESLFRITPQAQVIYT